MIEQFLTYLRLERNRSPLTIDAYRRDLRQLLSFLKQDADSAVEYDSGSEILLEADTRDIREWLAREAEKGCVARSLRRKAQSVRSFYNWAVITGKLNRNPAIAIQLAKASKPLPGFVTDEEMEQVSRLRLATDPVQEMRDHLIIEMLYGCGLRQAELRAIVDADIDSERAELRVHGKGGKTRIVPLAPPTIARIKEWQTVRDGCVKGCMGHVQAGHTPLIPGRGGHPLSDVRLYQIVRSALSGTKTFRRSPHILRHSFATAMLNGGADIMTVKEFLGHSSLSSTQIYTHLNLKELQRDYRNAHPRAAHAGYDVDTDPAHDKGARGNKK